MLLKIFFAFLFIQIDLIFWGFLCFILMWLNHKIRKTASFEADVQAMTKRHATIGLVACEIIHLPFIIVLWYLFANWQNCTEYYFLLLGINITLHIIRSIVTIHHLPSIKKEFR